MDIYLSVIFDFRLFYLFVIYCSIYHLILLENVSYFIIIKYNRYI